MKTHAIGIAVAGLALLSVSPALERADRDEWRTPDQVIDALKPPKESRVTFEKCVEEMKRAGFTLAEAPDFLPHQFFAIFRKSAR